MKTYTPSSSEFLISVNGAPFHHSHPLTVTELTRELALTEKRYAIERNGEIVPRSQHDNTLLASGDKLEIVVAVGGG